MNNRQDDRRSVRFQHGNLSVTVKRSGLFAGLPKPQRVEWMDYNRLGMAFESEGKFYLTSKVLLTLAISDVKDVSLSKVVAHVRNIGIRSGSKKYRYGVEFDYRANNYMKSTKVKNALVDIENLLKDIFQRIKETE